MERYRSEKPRDSTERCTGTQILTQSRIRPGTPDPQQPRVTWSRSSPAHKERASLPCCYQQQTLSAALQSPPPPVSPQPWGGCYTTCDPTSRENTPLMDLEIRQNHQQLQGSHKCHYTARLSAISPQPQLSDASQQIQLLNASLPQSSSAVMAGRAGCSWVSLRPEQGQRLSPSPQQPALLSVLPAGILQVCSKPNCSRACNTIPRGREAGINNKRTVHANTFRGYANREVGWEYITTKSSNMGR